MLHTKREWESNMLTAHLLQQFALEHYDMRFNMLAKIWTTLSHKSCSATRALTKSRKVSQCWTPFLFFLFTGTFVTSDGIAKNMNITTPLFWWVFNSSYHWLCSSLRTPELQSLSGVINHFARLFLVYSIVLVGCANMKSVFSYLMFITFICLFFSQTCCFIRKTSTWGSWESSWFENG